MFSKFFFLFVIVLEGFHCQDTGDATLEAEYKELPSNADSGDELTAFAFKKIWYENIKGKTNRVCKWSTERQKTFCKELFNLKEIKEVTGAEYDIDKDTRSEIKCVNKVVAECGFLPVIKTHADMIQCITSGESTLDMFKNAKFFTTYDHDNGYGFYYTKPDKPDVAIFINRIRDVFAL